jgi:cell division protein ZipA
VESLRWILLGAGFIFVIIIYILGRSRRRRQHSNVDEVEDDLPAFCAQSLDDLDHLDEGVGKVRVVTGGGYGRVQDSRLDLAEEDIDTVSVSDDVALQQDRKLVAEPEQYDKSADDHIAEDQAAANRAAEAQAAEDEAAKATKKISDIIVVYILPKGDKRLLGSQIKSSSQAMGLSFGEMNIFHFKRDGRSIFSLANMLEPGSFDQDTINDLTTTGLTLFMQIKTHNPLDDLSEMLQRSYQLAGLLNARLCNHKRQPLTEQDAENYRAQIRAFIAQ